MKIKIKAMRSRNNEGLVYEAGHEGESRRMINSRKPGSETEDGMTAKGNACGE